jgi:hypothetical protein
VIFDQRAKYEVGKLKDPAFIQKLQANFEDLNTCLRQMYPG